MPRCGTAWWPSCEARTRSDIPIVSSSIGPADAFRNVRMVEQPKGDWAFTIVRQYLFDSAEQVRLTALVDHPFGLGGPDGGQDPQRRALPPASPAGLGHAPGAGHRRKVEAERRPPSTHCGHSPDSSFSHCPERRPCSKPDFGHRHRRSARVGRPMCERFLKQCQPGDSLAGPGRRGRSPDPLRPISRAGGGNAVRRSPRAEGRVVKSMTASADFRPESGSGQS